MKNKTAAGLVTAMLLLITAGIASGQTEQQASGQAEGAREASKTTKSRWLRAQPLPGLLNERFRATCRASIGIAGAVSHTGYSTALLPQVSYRQHSFYAGPRLLVDDSYLPYRNIWSINTGYFYSLLKNSHWEAVAGADYQCSFYKTYNPYNLPAPANRVQELTATVGISWRPDPAGRLAAMLQLGSGIYFDTYHDLIQNKRHNNAGRTSLIRISLHYLLF
jgi:hypothetical protein